MAQEVAVSSRISAKQRLLGKSNLHTPTAPSPAEPALSVDGPVVHRRR
jgi:hypothetical protein